VTHISEVAERVDLARMCGTVMYTYDKAFSERKKVHMKKFLVFINQKSKTVNKEWGKFVLKMAPVIILQALSYLC
jgi:hypothetical protein